MSKTLNTGAGAAALLMTWTLCTVREADAGQRWIAGRWGARTGTAVGGDR